MDRWRFAIGLAASAASVGLLYWLIDWRLAAAALSNMDMRWIGLGAVLLLSAYATFAIRWWVLLQCDPALSPPRLFGALMMGLAVNVSLPLRPGDALRVYLVGHVYRAGASRVLGSVVLERFFDVATILFLGGFVALRVPLPGPMRSALVGTAALVGVAVIALVFFAILSRPISAFLGRMTAASRATAVIASQMTEFAKALAIGRSPVRWGGVVIASLLGWAFYSMAMIACGMAFGIPYPVIGGLLMTVLTNLGGMIPSSPGSIGVYHALAVLALSAARTSQGPALAVAVASHALIVVIQLAAGVLAFSGESGTVRDAIRRRRLEKQAEGT
jgi:uncharacterized protein (TIRG00374 family)